MICPNCNNKIRITKYCTQCGFLFPSALIKKEQELMKKEQEDFIKIKQQLVELENQKQELLKEKENIKTVEQENQQKVENAPIVESNDFKDNTIVESNNRPQEELENNDHLVESNNQVQEDKKNAEANTIETQNNQAPEKIKIVYVNKKATNPPGYVTGLLSLIFGVFSFFLLPIFASIPLGIVTLSSKHCKSAKTMSIIGLSFAGFWTFIYTIAFL